jgi:methyl-accepting chemotaxis protein
MKSIQKKIMISFVTLTVIVAIISSGYEYWSNNKELLQYLQNEVKNNAISASLLIDGDLHKKLAESREQDGEIYHRIRSKLQRFQELTGVTYVYTLAKTGDNSTEFIIDADLDDPVDLGEKYDMLPDMIKAFNGEVSFDKEISTDEWGSYISGYAPIKDSNGDVVGIIGIDIDAQRAINGRNKLLITEAIKLLINIITMILIALVISGRIVKPIKDLAAMLKELSTSGGDLTKRIQISTGDEIEELGNNVSDFINYIKKIVIDIVSTAQDVGNESKMMKYSIDENNKALENINLAIQSLTIGNSNQAEYIENINEKISNISSNLIKDNNDMSKMNDSAKKSVEIIENGLSTVKDLNNKTEISLNAFEDIYKAVEELKNGVSGIEEITKTITDISEQINLLSLNATIEAASAGESGKGFTIVAQEIRKLADKTSASAKYIADLVQRVTNDTNVATSEMDRVSTTINQQKDSVQETGHAFDSIYEEVYSIVNGLESLSKSVNDVTIDVEEVTKKMQEVFVIAQENVGIAEEIVASTEQQTATMEGLGETATRLEESGENLRLTVSNFKVD